MNQHIPLQNPLSLPTVSSPNFLSLSLVAEMLQIIWVFHLKKSVKTILWCMWGQYGILKGDFGNKPFFFSFFCCIWKDNNGWVPLTFFFFFNWMSRRKKKCQKTKSAMTTAIAPPTQPLFPVNRMPDRVRGHQQG